MATKLQFDTTRTSLSEASFIYSRSGGDIRLYKGTDGLLHQWTSGAITLAPVNMVSDFTQTPRYEAAKYANSASASDCVFNPDYWSIVPEQSYWAKFNPLAPNDPTLLTQQFDYFFVGKIPGPVVMRTVSPGEKAMFYLPLKIQEAFNQVEWQLYNEKLDTDVSLPVVYSAKEQPANQGYNIRFQITLRESGFVFSPLRFYFGGQFCIDFGGDGTGRFYQSGNNQAMRLMATFQWCDPGTVYNRWHSIYIYPHGRGLIEISRRNDNFLVNGPGVEVNDPSFDGDFIFRLAAPPDYNSAGEPIVTQPGVWAFICSRRCSPHVQVSRICFYDGAAGQQASFVDDAFDFGYVPQQPVTLSMDFALHGGNINAILLDGNSVGIPFLPLPFLPKQSQAFMFGATLRGIGDIASSVGGTPNYSSVTPEFYCYTVQKDPGFTTGTATPQDSLVRAVRIDTGDSPENESLVVRVPAGPGTVGADYTDRTESDVILYDDETGVIWFEGTATDFTLYSTTSGPIELELQCRGMVDALLLNDPLNLSFDSDPGDTGHHWKWQDALRKCFELGGQPGASIEFKLWNGKDASFLNFELWPLLGKDSSDSAKGPIDSAGLGLWRPNFQVGIHEFIDHMIRQIFGWHWIWSRKGRNWLAYKRPQPPEIIKNGVLLDGVVPVCAFFGSEDALTVFQNSSSPFADVPCYLHSNWKQKGLRPQYTTLDAAAAYLDYGVDNQTVLAQLTTGSAATQSGSTAPSASNYDSVSKPKYTTADNPNSYDHEGMPPVSRNSPDFVNKQRRKFVNVLEATNDKVFGWITRRYYEDICIGYQQIEFSSDWDEATGQMKRWDLVLIDPDPESQDPTTGFAWFGKAEAEWAEGSPKRAQFLTYKYRKTVPPPR